MTNYIQSLIVNLVMLEAETHNYPMPADVATSYKYMCAGYWSRHAAHRMGVSVNHARGVKCQVKKIKALIKINAQKFF